MQTIVTTLECEQHHAACSRYTWPQPVPTHQQYNPNTGLIWSAFRPSDDPVTYRYNIPQNAMAVVAMRLLAMFAVEAFGDHSLAQRATTLANEVRAGVMRYGRTYNPKYKWMYVYETDGYGHENIHGRRQHAEFDGPALLRLVFDERRDLSRHAPLHALTGRSVLF